MRKYRNKYNEEEVKLIYQEWEKTYSKYKVECFSGIKEVIKTKIISTHY